MEDLKKIVAVFIKKEPSEIDSHTLINNTVVSGSILIHRMYAAINNAGYSVKEYNDINTFGELLTRLNLNPKSDDAPDGNQQKTFNVVINPGTASNAVGIDIESISNFPVVTDFREDSFYKLNFSPSEISYCLLRENPPASFAGLFSVKEALCKVNNNFRNVPFDQIGITHDQHGKPLFPGFSVSISHNDQFSIAIAISDHLPAQQKTISEEISLQDVSFAKYDKKLNALTRNVYFLFTIIVILIALLIYLLLK